MTMSHQVIELLSDSDDENVKKKDITVAVPQQIELLSDSDGEHVIAKNSVVRKNGKLSSAQKLSLITATKNSRGQKKNLKLSATMTGKKLQAGIVLEDDGDDLDREAIKNGSSTIATMQIYIQEQLGRKRSGLRPILYHDDEFETIPSSIEGPAKKNSVTKCRCSPPQPVMLSFSTSKGPNFNRPYQHCAKRRCKYFRWAFQAEQMHWYRFGPHTGHVLVTDEGFLAEDLLQGKVGDCWFLSALAVVAERPDLIMRLFGANSKEGSSGTVLNEYGIVQITLFLDGFWKKVVIDNFLPCMIDKKAEQDFESAIKASLGYNKKISIPKENPSSTLKLTSSEYDPSALSSKNREVLHSTQEVLQKEHDKKTMHPLHSRNCCFKTPKISQNKLERAVTSNDLAYSKAKKNQLWVPLLEKAYAKSHGCYQAISGGHIAEAFLDLTGAPTLVYNFDSRNFHARTFWSKLMTYRDQRLPMGCGTSQSQAGLVGMHAYSILDVREVHNVSFEFFKDKMLTGTLGNVSGFTDFDGTVRLLRIRNPHGRGEWKGEFSDRSEIWEKLLNSGGSGLHRTMKNDGTFWIDYDNFLLGFSNVDVVLAYMGNHAKSFVSSFPPKKSNFRCTRAFEVSFLENEEHNVRSRDSVEFYVMGIQKTRRGAYHGRSDRKKSYKVCDFGIMVGYYECDSGDALQSPSFRKNDTINFSQIDGQMFGFKRNGHYRIVLNRKKKNTRVIVMPVSFGHPAATDKELSFVLRFVSDAPLLIREVSDVPRLDVVMQQFCLNRKSVKFGAAFQSGQRTKQILLDRDPFFRIIKIDCLANGGGTVFIYLCVNEDEMKRSQDKESNFRTGFNLSIEANCRGMMCRTADGLLEHKTISKGKKFEAAWRRYTSEFKNENMSRLLMVLFQSGQDTQMGSIKCKKVEAQGLMSGGSNCLMSKFLTKTVHSDLPSATLGEKFKSDDYQRYGIFNGVKTSQWSFLHSNKDVEEIDTVASNNYFDLEMEQALALSRSHDEMKQAIEMSLKDSATSEDLQLQRALEMITSNSTKTGFESDIQRAIMLSSQVNETTETQEVEMAKQISMREANMSIQAIANKNAFDVGDLSDDEVIEITPYQKGGKRNLDNIGTISEENMRGCNDRETRRNLAAEAAMKRIKLKTDGGKKLKKG